MVIYDFVKWKSIDIYRNIQKKRKGIKENPHIYGIVGYFGLYGSGKTMAMTYELEKMRRKYGNDIYIATNYFWKGQDFAFSTWKQMLKEYDKPLIIGWDEVQNEFNSRDFKSFPVELLSILTQVRKGNGIRIYYTAQRYDRVDKVFRELTFEAGECKTILGRWTRVKFYHWLDYERLNDVTNIDVRRKIKPIRIVSFVQDDEIRNSYDSYKMLESAKSKEYMTREEVVKLL